MRKLRMWWMRSNDVVLFQIMSHLSKPDHYHTNSIHHHIYSYTFIYVLCISGINVVSISKEPAASFNLLGGIWGELTLGTYHTFLGSEKEALLANIEYAYRWDAKACYKDAFKTCLKEYFIDTSSQTMWIDIRLWKYDKTLLKQKGVARGVIL